MTPSASITSDDKQEKCRFGLANDAIRCNDRASPIIDDQKRGNLARSPHVAGVIAERQDDESRAPSLSPQTAINALEPENCAVADNQSGVGLKALVSVAAASSPNDDDANLETDALLDVVAAIVATAAAADNNHDDDNANVVATAAADELPIRATRVKISANEA